MPVRKVWYAIRHASDMGLWWMSDPSGVFDGGWTRDPELASRMESRSSAGMWASRVGGEVVAVESSG